MFLNVRFLGAELAVFGTIPAIDRDKRQRQQWLMTRPRPKRTVWPTDVFVWFVPVPVSQDSLKQLFVLVRLIPKGSL